MPRVWKGFASTERSLPRLHALVSEREIEDPDRLEIVERLMEREVPTAVHLRARLPGRRLFEVALRLAAVAGSRSWVVVNGRPDIALAAGGRAVQLGRTALGVEETRRFISACRGKLAVGASVHDAEGAIRAVRAGADFLALGTIYPTPSHPGYDGSGPGAVATVSARLDESVSSSERAPPILAIGGVNVLNVNAVIEAGAYGAVVGRAIWEADEPLAAAHELDEAIELWTKEADVD